MSTERAASGYAAANDSVALIDRSARVRMEITGPERVKMLQNLTTNDIKRLEPNAGVEAFLTSGQGRTLAYLSIHNVGERLLVRSDAGTAEAILGHFARYGLFEDATTCDTTVDTTEWHVCGPGAVELISDLCGVEIQEDLAVLACELDDQAVRVIRESPTGRPGITVIEGISHSRPLPGQLARAVAASGGCVLTPDEFDALRIEAGTPVFGKDITPANLPQEVNRDAQAISFVKGCYLGQETVARLDALGHVNNILVGLLADSDRVPPPGSALRADDKDIGVVTSSAFSPGWSRGVALGYVKVAHASAGSRVTALTGEEPISLEVRSWPMISE